MTYKEAVAWLSRGYRTRERIRAKEQRILSWEETATQITAILHNTPPSPSMPSRKIEKAAVEIADIKDTILQEIEVLKAVETEIAEAIPGTLTNKNHIALLELRYTAYLSWRAISQVMGYTLRWTLSLHREAVTEFAKKKAL